MGFPSTCNNRLYQFSFPEFFCCSDSCRCFVTAAHKDGALSSWNSLDNDYEKKYIDIH